MAPLQEHLQVEMSYSSATPFALTPSIEVRMGGAGENAVQLFIQLA